MCVRRQIQPRHPSIHPSIHPSSQRKLELLAQTYPGAQDGNKSILNLNDVQHSAAKLKPRLLEKTHSASGRTEPCRRCSDLCVKAAAHRTGSELIIIKPHPSFPYLAWVGWSAANHPAKGSKSRKSIILPPSQSHWHAQSAHGHQHQPPRPLISPTPLPLKGPIRCS